MREPIAGYVLLDESTMQRRKFGKYKLMIINEIIIIRATITYSLHPDFKGIIYKSCNPKIPPFPRHISI
jgi:hypothetical protein